MPSQSSSARHAIGVDLLPQCDAHGRPASIGWAIVSEARLVEAEDLHRRFGDIHAVDGVSLHIEAGETYGLLGPNGAGKTTTINVLTGLLEPDEGTVTVAGTRIRPGSIAGKSAIGLVPQDLAIYPDLTGEENLRFFASLYGLPRAETRARIDEVLDVIGLADRRKDRTSKYSGGMKRRLNIGIGLLNRPRLLVLDEPTVGVDPQSRNAILESVKVIAEGTTQQLVARIGEREQLRIGATGDLDGAADKVRVLDGISKAS